MEARHTYPHPAMTDGGVQPPQQLGPVSEAREAVVLRSPTGQEKYEKLESKNWAPWLQFSPENFDQQQATFPEGQIVIEDGEGELMAALSASRVQWDGNPRTAPSWDQVAGEDSSFRSMFDQNGNTFVLMSMSVDPEMKYRGVSSRVFANIRNYAQEQGIEHIIGDFRPSGFGEYKRETGKCDFAAYCAETREDGQLRDPWLRSVSRQGGEMLRPDYRAMVVPATAEEALEWSRTYNPDKWWEVTDSEQLNTLYVTHQPLAELEHVDHVLECGETGTWYIDAGNNKAVYIESNMLGKVPVEDTHQTEAQIYELPAADNYHLPEVQFEQLQNEMVSAIKEQFPEPDVYVAWIKSDHRFADLVRTLEARQFPEIPELVNELIEDRSTFMALVDTRDGEDRIVHAYRLSGMDQDGESVQNNAETSGFIVVDEAIQEGELTLEGFRAFCEEQGLDIDSSISVETNFRVGERVAKRDGLRISDIGYVTFFRKVFEAGGHIGESGVFASVNRAAKISLGALGVQHVEIPRDVEPGADSNHEGYDLVVYPATDETVRIMTEVGQFVTVKETTFDHN